MFFKREKPAVLFADDERILVEFLAFLYDRQFKIYAAWEIEQAVKILKEKKAHVALIEPWFRTERSMEFVSQLTALQATFGLPPVVVLTHRPPEEIKVAEPILRPVAVLQKPAPPDAIDVALNRAIAIARNGGGNGF